MMGFRSLLHGTSLLLGILLVGPAIDAYAQTDTSSLPRNSQSLEFKLGVGNDGSIATVNSGAVDSSGVEGADAADSDERPKETIAQVLEEALKEEFKHEEEKQAEVGKQFNETVSRDEGTQETVVIISQKKEKEKDKAAAAAAAATAGGSSDGSTDGSADDAPKGTTTDAAHDSIFGGGTKISDFIGGGGGVGETKSGTNATSATATNTSSSGTAGAAAHHSATSSLSMEGDVDRIIDSHDNEYVLSKPNEEGSMGLTLDPQLIRDVGVLVVAAALAGLSMEALGQPTINGYFVAGSLVGPGGLQWIKEIVQVQSIAQLGVQLLLFTLGLELSASKLRAVRDVAVVGGLLELALMAGLGGAAAAGIGAGAPQGAFIGALLAMSSTSIVIKCLQEARVAHHCHAQITIGTLVLQDCVVGLLFAFTPVLAAAAGGGGGVSFSELLAVAGRVLATLAITVAVAAAMAALILPSLTSAAARYSAETFQLTCLAFCFASAMATTRLGISAELGAFLAGVLLSATDHQETVLHAVEPATQLFLALFVASTGLAIAPRFLLEHLPVLAAGVAVVIAAKSLIVTGTVVLFRYPLDTALAVGINLAQVGEFGFVLLSLASQQGVIGSHVYLLLMGITALSLLVTPFLLQLSTRLVVRSRTSLGSPTSATDVELAAQGGGLVSSKARSPMVTDGGEESTDDGVSGAVNGHRAGGQHVVARRPTSVALARP